jgi:hypothetical protein
VNAGILLADPWEVGEAASSHHVILFSSTPEMVTTDDEEDEDGVAILAPRPGKNVLVPPLLWG